MNRHWTADHLKERLPLNGHREEFKLDTLLSRLPGL